MNAINPQNQLTDLLGITQKDTSRLKEKIEYVTRNIDRITKINGTNVFNPIVDGLHIRYNLQDFLKFMPYLKDQREYYYPIEYANIEYL